MITRFRNLLLSVLLLCFFNAISQASIVNIQLTLTDSTSNVLSELAVGDDFFLNVYVQDARGVNALGVFSAYTDVTYDPTLATPTGEIEYGSLFPNGRRGRTISNPGLIDDAGGFRNSFGPTPALPAFLFRLPMMSIAAGQLEFASDPADNRPFTDILLADALDFVSPNDVDYGAVSATIVEAVPEPSHVVLTMMLIGILAGAVHSLRG